MQIRPIRVEMGPTVEQAHEEEGNHPRDDQHHETPVQRFEDATREDAPIEEQDGQLDASQPQDEHEQEGEFDPLDGLDLFGGEGLVLVRNGVRADGIHRDADDERHAAAGGEEPGGEAEEVVDAEGLFLQAAGVEAGAHGEERDEGEDDARGDEIGLVDVAHFGVWGCGDGRLVCGSGCWLGRARI